MISSEPARALAFYYGAMRIATPNRCLMAVQLVWHRGLVEVSRARGLNQGIDGAARDAASSL